jgi:hypothetical protein
MTALPVAFLFVLLQVQAPLLAQTAAAHDAKPTSAAQTVLIAQNSAPAAGGSQPSSTPTQTVRVADMPPLSMAKDWSDWSYWLFTFFLAIIGGFQVYLLWGNLRAIERQALQMERQTSVLEKSVDLAEKNADTAKKNLEMFVSRERGHLRVELMPIEWPLKPGTANLSYHVTLYGSTEAYITSSCARAELTDSSEPIDDPHWYPAMNIPQVITPEHRMAEGVVHGIFPRMSLEQSDIDAIDAGKKFIHLRGFVKYNDVFGTERWARFRRVWELSAARNPDGSRSGHWGKRGGAKENSES